MVEEYVSLKRVNASQARDLIDRQFAELDSFISLEYERDIGYIDRKINTYYNLYAMRISMVLGNGTNLEQTLNRLLLLLKESSVQEREEILCHIASAHRLLEFKFVGRKSIERRRRRKADKPGIGLAQDTLSAQELERLTDELLKGRPDRYSMDKVKAYLDRLPITEEGMPIEACGIRRREDAMMAAASIIYSGSIGFPYEVEFGNGMVETEVAAISAFRIKKKTRQEGFYE